ncbi:MAG: hypothetical protein D6820_13460 [Lentisphaerae bacterium]|nr:MAG: hypothetical protein D6820_13460 [Lentisphaerota bacterium]
MTVCAGRTEPKISQYRELFGSVRRTLVSAPDRVCPERAILVTEAYRRYAGEPMPIRRARAFAHVLENMTLDLQSNPFFAGNTSSTPHAVMLLPEYGFKLCPQIAHETCGLKECFEEGVRALPEDVVQFWEKASLGGTSGGIGHLAVDFGRVVREGLAVIIAECEAHLHEGTEAQQQYRRAMLISLEAVCRWAERYAQAAQEAARNNPDPVARFLYRRIAEACRRVPRQPARNLFEGLQSILLCHFATAIEGHGLSISIGLPDRVLAHLVDTVRSQDECDLLCGAFILKVAQNSVFGRGSKTQAITVGGADEHGEDCGNRVTLGFLRGADLARVGDPHLFLRWHRHLSSEVWEEACRLLAGGLSMPLLINDEPTANAFIDAGCKPADAWNYCVIGCNELGIPGKSMESACASSGTIQLLEYLQRAIDEDGARNCDEILAAIRRRMGESLRRSRKGRQEHWPKLAAQVPTPFTSALMTGCPQWGCDLLERMVYNIPGHYERGLSNAVNAMVAIEHYGVEALKPHLANNFSDAHFLAQLKKLPKWGNDDPRADRWAGILLELREEVLREIDAEFGHGAHMVCHVVRSLHYFDGQRIPATADGRLAWTPVADSIGAVQGTQRQGVTALLNSVLKIDARRYYKGGYNLNITLPMNGTNASLIRVLAETFFQRGGQELQINVFSVDLLRDAQRNPQAYHDLIVRVAGLSSRFIDLSPVEQEELIARLQNS